MNYTIVPQDSSNQFFITNKDAYNCNGKIILFEFK